MNFLSVFSGIDAASVAWLPLGWKCLGFSEVDKFASAVLAHRWPHVPNLGDITRFLEWPEKLLARVDILAGGSPCQAFSVAGLRASLADDRGNLTLVYAKLIDHIDSIRARHGRPPVICVWENVPGVLSTADNAFGCFLAALAGEELPLVPPGGKWADAGYVRGPARAMAWRLLDAQYFGLAQRRERVFLVGSAREGFRPEQILFESDGLRRDTPPRRETGERVAGTLTKGSLDGSSPCGGDGRESFLTIADPLTSRPYQDRGSDDNNLIPEISPSVTSKWAKGSGGPSGDECQNLLAVGVDYTNGILTEELCGTLEAAQSKGNRGQGVLSLDLTHTLTGNGFDASEDNGFDASEDGTGRGTPLVPVAFQTSGNCGAWETGDITSAIDTMTDPNSHILAFSCKDHGADAGEISPTLRSMGHDGSHANGGGQVATFQQSGSFMAVRRIIPNECARLQGFPDDHARIPWRGKPADQCPDGPQYKVYGNSWATHCAHFIGRRLALYLSRPAA